MEDPLRAVRGWGLFRFGFLVRDMSDDDCVLWMAVEDK